MLLAPTYEGTLAHHISSRFFFIKRTNILKIPWSPVSTRPATAYRRPEDNTLQEPSLRHAGVGHSTEDVADVVEVGSPRRPHEATE